nr:hypothetical protein [Angustibacter aerolatus]
MPRAPRRPPRPRRGPRPPRRPGPTAASPARLAARGASKSLGSRFSGAVIDVATDRVVWQRGGSKRLMPASTTKPGHRHQRAGRLRRRPPLHHDRAPWQHLEQRRARRRGRPHAVGRRPHLAGEADRGEGEGPGPHVRRGARRRLAVPDVPAAEGLEGVVRERRRPPRARARRRPAPRERHHDRRRQGVRRQACARRA